MQTNEYGQVLFDTSEIISMLYNQQDIHKFAVSDLEEIKKHSNHANIFEIANTFQHEVPSQSPLEYHKTKASNWNMPEEYKNLDVYSVCMTRLEKLNLTDTRYQPVLEDELHEFAKRDMMDILRFMCYMVKVVEDNDIVTGVGRGSSVSSLVLYLIGVHHIDPIKYNLSYQEFLR